MCKDAARHASLRMHAVGATDVGRARKHNEDVVLIREDLQLFIVADGAGGHEAGEVASHLAARSIANYLEATEDEAYHLPEFDRFGLPTAARRLSRAVHKANRDVHEISMSYEKTHGMGTTVVAVLFSPRSALVHVAHLGDSRCYRFRERHLELLTQDHSVLTDVLEERPEIEEDVLASLPKHVVTRALGMQPSTRISLRSYEVLAGDRYLLCSDGLSGYVPAETLSGILANPRPRGAIVQLLLNAANDAGGRDNITALIADSVPLVADSVPLVADSVPLVADSARPADARAGARSPDHVEAEGTAALARGEGASGPELLLLGIEELDLSAPEQSAPDATTGDTERRALARLMGKVGKV